MGLSLMGFAKKLKTIKTGPKIILLLNQKSKFYTILDCKLAQLK